MDDNIIKGAFEDSGFDDFEDNYTEEEKKTEDENQMEDALAFYSDSDDEDYDNEDDVDYDNNEAVDAFDPSDEQDSGSMAFSSDDSENEDTEPISDDEPTPNIPSVAERYMNVSTAYQNLLNESNGITDADSDDTITITSLIQNSNEFFDWEGADSGQPQTNKQEEDQQMFGDNTDVFEAGEAPKKTEIKAIRGGYLNGEKVVWHIDTSKESKENKETKTPLRKYTNKANYPSSVFAKPKKKKSLKDKLIIYAIVCCCASCFFAVQANSYYAIKPSGSALHAMLAWMTLDSMETTLTPFYSDIFFNSFAIAFAVSAVICLMAYLNSQTKEQRRIGHEHGNARLATKIDYKKYKKRHM